MTPAGASARPLRADAWRGLAGLRAQAGPWSRLAEASAADRLCNSHAWAQAHAEAFSEPRSVFGWTLFDGDEPVGLGAFREEPSRSPLALRRALLAADGTFDSDYLEPLAAPGWEGAVCRALLEGLATRSHVEAVVWSGLPTTSRFLSALRAACDERGLPAREHPVPCCAAPLPARFEDYLASLKPRMRSKVRSAMRGADEAGAAFVWTTDANELERDLEGLFRLHAMRWQERDQAGSFADERRRRFYGLLCPPLLERGELRLCRLEWDGEPVAYQVGALAGGAYYQLQEGFHTGFEKQRVGTALRGLAIRDLIAAGVESYDFMAGVTRHKTDWGAVPRPCTTLSVGLPGLRARLSFGAKNLVDRLRDVRGQTATARAD